MSTGRIFEWDPEKARKNVAKHGISFELASTVFDDPAHVTELDQFDEYGEARFKTIGLAAGVKVLLVAHTSEDEQGLETIRIISARHATSKEESIYDDENG